MNTSKPGSPLEGNTTQDGSDSDCLSTEVVKISTTCTLLPDVLFAVRYALKKQRTINTLPTEILVKIFSSVADKPLKVVYGAVERFCGPFSITNVSDLLPITQTCHHWRDVALGVPCLWSSAFIVPPTDSRLHNTYACHLSRCIAGPIALYVEVDAKDHVSWQHPRANGILQEYRDRVRELHVDIVTTHGWRPVGMMPFGLSHPLPALRRLTLRCSCIVDARDGRAWWACQPLFAGCTLPHLRSLAILNIPFLPANTGLSSLTHLVLSYNYRAGIAGSRTWRVEDLLYFLNNTSALEEAYLSGIPRDVVDNPALPSVSLPQLRKLSIRAWDHPWVIAGISFPLLSHLVLPSSCYVRLDAGSGEQLRLLSQWVERSRLDHTGTRVHCVCNYNSHGVPIATSVQATYLNRSGGIRIDIPQAFLWEDNLCTQAVQDLLLTPPFAAAEALWVSGVAMDDESDTGATAAASLFRTLPNVKELYIVHDAGSPTPMGFLTSLGTAVSTASRLIPSQHLPFPALEMLYAYLRIEDELDRCADMLRQRAEAGYRIPHLLIRSPALGGPSRRAIKSWEQVETALKAHVGKLTILDERGYWDTYALRMVLPPPCTEGSEEGLSNLHSLDTMCLWPPWTEGQETSNVLLLH